MKGKPTRGKATDVARVIELYQQGISMNEIGKQLGHPHGVISYHIHKSGIALHNPRSQQRPIATNHIKELYQQGMSTIEISENVGLTPQSVYQRLLKAGIRLRSFSEAISLSAKRGRKKQQMGELNAKWKGGRAIDRHGYISVRVNGKQRAEHRVIWEKAHGIIPKDWVIHHLNGIRVDNRLENLCALPRNRHSPSEIIKPHQERIRQLERQVDKLQRGEHDKP